MEELQEQIVRAEAQQKQRDEMLDRFSEFTAKRPRLIRWGGQHLLAACFRAWNKATQRTVAKRSALRRLLGQRYKRQQLVSFYHWKVNVQQLQQQNQLQDQRDRYEDRIVGTDKEYQLKIHQLQQEIEEAKSQVAESQKCRQKLEEDLRLIFLRGVSAMNIEALTVFGSNHSQNLKLGDLGQWVPPSRQQEKKQIAIPTKTTISSSANDLSVGVPEGIRPPEIPNPNSSLGAKLSAPVRIEAPSSVHASPSHGRVPVVRTQMQPSISRASNSWRVSSSSGLRSAEMIRLHELSSPVGHQIMSRSALSFARKSSAPSPTKRRSSSQSNTKYQVELQYMRSTVAPRLSGGGRTVSSTRSPQSSATRRRA
ncbi:unnamed protein product [Phytophthora lilii]|uniref:Centrosomal protein POC5 n=1 Tax=Phytophthora lilii TaxID=2077276 RepID=A0A9W7CR98_9STRA|nr:unnamed protein product [Phytophthora lilii]